jgi:integrase
MQTKILNRQQVRDIVKLVKTSRDKALLQILSSFGLRISEALELTFNDFDDNELNIKSKKGSNSVKMPIPDRVKRVIKELLDYYKAKGLTIKKDTKLFLSRNGVLKVLTRQRAWQLVKEVTEKLKIKNVGTHSFRKAFIDSIYKATNFDLVKTRLLSRHKNLNNLVYYVDANQDKSVMLGLFD